MMSRMGFGDTQANAERSYDICHAIVRHLSCNCVTYVKQLLKPTFASPMFGVCAFVSLRIMWTHHPY